MTSFGRIMKAKKKVVVAQEEAKPLKLDLGCGDNKKEGFTGVDKFKTSSTDIVHDLLKFPWPFKDESVEEIHSSHFFEHIPQADRPKFMEEVHRILIPGGKASFITPYYKSPRATQDFTHQWPPISEETYLYFNKAWREANKLTHGYYSMTCDFDFTYGYAIDGAWTLKSEEARGFAMRHYWNVISDLWVTLIKR